MRLCVNVRQGDEISRKDRKEAKTQVKLEHHPAILLLKLFSTIRAACASVSSRCLGQSPLHINDMLGHKRVSKVAVTALDSLKHLAVAPHHVSKDLNGWMQLGDHLRGHLEH